MFGSPLVRQSGLSLLNPAGSRDAGVTHSQLSWTFTGTKDTGVHLHLLCLFLWKPHLTFLTVGFIVVSDKLLF